MIFWKYLPCLNDFQFITLERLFHQWNGITFNEREKTKKTYQKDVYLFWLSQLKQDKFVLYSSRCDRECYFSISSPPPPFFSLSLKVLFIIFYSLCSLFFLIFFHHSSFLSLFITLNDQTQFFPLSPLVEKIFVVFFGKIENSFVHSQSQNLNSRHWVIVSSKHHNRIQIFVLPFLLLFLLPSRHKSVSKSFQKHFHIILSFFVMFFVCFCWDWHFFALA